MHLTFTREEYWNYSPEDGIDLGDCWGYTIYKAEDVVGYFFFNNRRSYAAFEEKRYLFEYKPHFFKRSEYFVTDLITNEPVAVTFTIPNVRSFLGTKDLMSVHKEVFQLYIEYPDIRFHLFNSDTWWWEKFSLRSDTNRITCQMQTKRPSLLASRVTEGTIESSCDNFLVIAAGLYLQERWREASSG